MHQECKRGYRHLAMTSLKAGDGERARKYAAKLVTRVPDVILANNT